MGQEIIQPPLLGGVENRIEGQLGLRPASHRGQQALVLVVGVGGCGVFEVYRPSPRAFQVPDVRQNEGWITWLQRNTEPTDAIRSSPEPPGPAWTHRPAAGGTCTKCL